MAIAARQKPTVHWLPESIREIPLFEALFFALSYRILTNFPGLVVVFPL